LDSPLPKLCPAVVLSHQDGHHSAVALLLKAGLIQVTDYRLQGASVFFSLSQCPKFHVFGRYMYRIFIFQQILMQIYFFELIVLVYQHNSYLLQFLR
jgi:hypothetical protein